MNTAVSSEEDPSVLAVYPQLQRDGMLALSLQEVAPLYRRVNDSLFTELLRSIEELLLLQGSPATARDGQRNVAHALRARRSANSALAELKREARRQFPCQAAEAAEDENAIGKAVADTLHNVQQSCTLAPLQ